MIPLTQDQMILIAILVCALVGFGLTKLRHDVVALCALIASVVTGLTPADEAFDGFGHPAVITVIGVLLISTALKNSGVVDLITAQVDAFSKRKLTHLTHLVGSVTFASSFMNNVGALALMMPVAIQSARSRDRPPSMFLMPLAFGSMLGGMITLIGTPPNIIVANLRTDKATGAEPFGMFDFTPVGLVVAVTGFVYLILVGWRLVPQRRSQDSDNDTVFSRQDFIVELLLTEESDYKGLTAREIQSRLPENAKMLGVLSEDGITPTRKVQEVGPEDVILARIDHDTLDKLISEDLFCIHREGAEKSPDDYDWTDHELSEFLVPADAQAIGQTLGKLDRMIGRESEIIALAQQGRRVKQRIATQKLAAGDVFLVEGSAETLGEMPDRFGVIPLGQKHRNLGAPRRLIASLVIFGAAVALTSTGVLSSSMAFLMAVLGMVAIGSLSPLGLYHNIDWPLIVLLGALFPVGDAMVSTELANVLAGAIVEHGQNIPVWALIAILMAITMLLSDVINNAATALVMAPIAIRLADNLSFSADPFLMAVAVGASSAFLTPIGHQSNTLVFTRGGYRFGDYWRAGLPLEVLIVLVATPMILYVWPVTP